MSLIFEALRRKKEFIPRPAPVAAEFANCPDFFQILPSRRAAEMRREIEEMLSSPQGITQVQFVEFAEKMIRLQGGYGHRLRSRDLLMLAAEIDDKSGKSFEVRRYMGDWSGPDATCLTRRYITASLITSFPVVYEESVGVFSYNPSIGPQAHRRLDVTFPALAPTVQSVTGEEIVLFGNFPLKDSANLDNDALRNVAVNMYEFYSNLQKGETG